MNNIHPQEPPEGDRGSSLRQTARKALGHFFSFMEIIGLRAERKDIDHAAQLARFKLYHTEFRKLLSANNNFLETLAELDKKRHGDSFVDRAYIQRKIIRAVADVHSMVQSLQVVSSGRYPGLTDSLSRVTALLTSITEESTGSGAAELVLDMGSIRASHADLVGGKMSNLGELRNVVGLPTPDGFAITTESYRLLLEEEGLRSWIQSRDMDPLLKECTGEASDTLAGCIRKLKLPARLEKAIMEAYERLAQRLGTRVAVAVRSSAVGEDTDLSFAGQFMSLLNVTAEGLVDAYVNVIASIYSPEAIHYRLLHHIPGESAEMAVGVIAMVDAVASGVVFSKDPNSPDSGQVLIHAVHGLGVTLVDGRASPEIIRVTLGLDPPEIIRTPSGQTREFVLQPVSGIREADMGLSAAREPCISDEEAVRLARWAIMLEAHFGAPQDIEWAIGKDRSLILLQSRLLRVFAPATWKERSEPGFSPLLDAGEIACPGVAAGQAVHVDETSDLDAFPEGGVLVARRSSPKFVQIMAKAAAIVTDAGSTTGHMAILARELRVPTLLNTKVATRVIYPGQMITVDAERGFVYEGQIAGLIERGANLEVGKANRVRPRPTPELLFLEKVLTYMAPLTLTDPRAISFKADQCKTLHDIARFIHEKSYQEMFGLGEKLGDFRSASYHLDVFLPIDLYIVDLGGGFKVTPKGREVKRSQIASAPMIAVLNGMLDKRIPRFGPRHINLGGLFSVMMRHATTSPHEQRSFQDPCYAMISDCYINYTARVGYHFSVLDAYCSETANKNYINLLFRGGAADRVRRCRRAMAIANILRHYGFSVTHNYDVVVARLNKGSLKETCLQLEMLGRLLQFFRQMDAAMDSDEHAAVFQDAFLRGDYNLGMATGAYKVPPDIS